jgi:adenine-specific DNA glycosylase
VKNIKIIYETDIEFFQQSLIGWYNENGRIFPWRNETASNYELILSEVFTKNESRNSFKISAYML